MEGLATATGGSRRLNSDDFDDFVRTCGPRLLATARLMAGGEGDDLVQSALCIAWVHRRSIREPAALEAYVRTCMTRLYLSRLRRSRREIPGDLPEIPQSSLDEQSLTEIVVTQALAQLTPRQRAVIVARHFDHFSETETAALLKCPVGTVKSTHSRALDHLRRELTAKGITLVEVQQGETSHDR